MIDKKYEEYLNNYLWCKTGIKSKTLQMIVNHQNCKEYIYIINRYTDSRSIQESVYRIKYNIDEIPKCPVCNKPNNYIGGKKGYTDHCCCVCTQLDKNVREKNKSTNLEKYGVENGAQSKQAKEKYIEHIRKKYNDNTIINAWQAKEVIQKIKDTTFKRYGVTNYALLPKHQLKLKSQEVIDKRNNTKKINHTFNTSISENTSYKILKEKYPDILYQYKSDVYPYYCDFYIPSLNLYIECNYHWTHGHHPYNQYNQNDINTINSWKEKNTKFYNNAITTWTVRDVNKRNIAKQNNLNYIEFWDIKELENWINNKNTI